MDYYKKYKKYKNKYLAYKCNVATKTCSGNQNK